MRMPPPWRRKFRIRLKILLMPISGSKPTKDNLVRLPNRSQTTHMPNTHESRARDEKARKLADFLILHGITSDQARLMTSQEWRNVAMCASSEYGETVHSPHSEATRQAVYERMENARPVRYSVAEFTKLVSAGDVQ